jgi:hypothetical protein
VRIATYSQHLCGTANRNQSWVNRTLDGIEQSIFLLNLYGLMPDISEFGQSGFSTHEIGSDWDVTSDRSGCPVSKAIVLLSPSV